MKNWKTLQPDRVRLLSKHFTPGRNGKRIDFVVIHHNAGNLSIDGIWDVWQSRQASAHYQVTSSGEIGQLVWDRDTAWHCANEDGNARSIGIEHANYANGTIPAATLDNGAHLTAAICAYYKLGEPRWKVNVYPHSYFTSTSCPGALEGAQHHEYMSKAAKYYRELTGAANPVPKPKPPREATTIERLTLETLAGKHGNGETRKRSLGANYNAVQARINQMSARPATAATIDRLARETLAGKHGNGEARKRSLGANYNAVQARVNQLAVR